MKKNFKIWGVRSDLIGDIIMAEPVLRILEQKYPGSYKYFSVLGKCSQAAPIFINHPLIDRIKISDLHDGFGLLDEEIKSSCHIVLNTRPPVIDDGNWYNLRGCVEECVLMAGFTKEDLFSLSPEDRKPHLYQWFPIERHEKTIAIWPFAGYGQGTSRSPSVAWWNDIIENVSARGYNIIHCGHPSEPLLENTWRDVDNSFFDQIKTTLGCDLAINTDSGSGWVIGAYGMPQINLVTNWFNNHHKNFTALVPENVKGLNIDLVGVGGCDNIHIGSVIHAMRALIES